MGDGSLLFSFFSFFCGFVVLVLVEVRGEGAVWLGFG